MFIKREDLVDMLEVIDCDNGYVDLDHLIECCNNLPSSGMSVWCMKCENNGECMSIDKPNCFQPRQADTPQTDKPTEWCEHCELWREDNCIGVAQCKQNIKELKELSDLYEADTPQTDCGWK